MAKVKTSFLFKTFFGSIPKTETIEETEKALLQEYKDITAFEGSEELKNILEMEKEINSEKFKKTLQAIKDDTFEKTDEYQKLQQFNKLKKSKAVRTVEKYEATADFEQVTAIEKTGKHKEIAKMEKEGEITDPTLMEYQKITSSKKYRKYQDALNSDDYSTYVKLDELVNTKEFQDFKAEKEDTERYKRTDEYKLQQKYEAAMDQELAKTYFGMKDSKKYEEIKNWEMTFFDDFDGKSLDQEKWITNYFWGKALMNESYSLATDKHFITDGDNIEIKGGVCKIVTKKENATGKSWDPRIGFYPREFGYTSGLISTGESFRQKEGRFQAKVRINSLNPVTHAFWMVSEKMVPQIDILKTGAKNKISIACHGKEGVSSLAKFGGSKYANDFFIFTFDWTAEKLVWKINNVVVREQTNDIPTEPMYVIFSSGLQTDPASNDLPAGLEIDWVKCYKKAEQKK